MMAAPVYGFGLPGPVKTAWDCCIYPFSKYYGDDPHGPALLAGIKLALVTTCGCPVEKGTGPLEDSVRMLAKHLQLQYVGMLAERHRNLKEAFMDPVKEARARRFARELAGM